LQLPAGLPARVHSLAASVAGAAPTRYDAVAAIDSYLQTHETYDLDAPEPAADADAVDDFFFVSGRGYCEQFATAAVVMLRSDGRRRTDPSRTDPSRTDPSRTDPARHCYPSRRDAVSGGNTVGYRRPVGSCRSRSESATHSACARDRSSRWSRTVARGFGRSG